MFKAPFSFKGRIRRKEYGISLLVYYIILILLAVYKEYVNPLLHFILLVPMIWVMLAQGTKRCHDLERNGFWQLIPFYGLWMLFESGAYGPNEYGPDPYGAGIGTEWDFEKSEFDPSQGHPPEQQVPYGEHPDNNDDNKPPPLPYQ